MKKKFLLDTCAWIWIAEGNRRITKAIQHKLLEAEWLLSAISVWEMATLVSKGKIELDRPIEEWLRLALIEVPRLSLAPLIPDIAITSCDLPNYKHGDPADRMIIATAIHHRAIIVTGDKRIIEYAVAGHLPVLPL